MSMSRVGADSSHPRRSFERGIDLDNALHKSELNPIQMLQRDDFNSPSSKGFVEEEGEYRDTDFLHEHYSILLLQMMNSSLGYGIVPAIISFACGKFDHSSRVLLFATGLSAFIDPWFRALTGYVRLPASSSLYKGYGGIFPVILYISFNSLFGFTNTCVFRFFKESVRFHVQHAYRWSGIASQTGALFGSVLAFALVVSNSL
eukprot:gene13003-9300_t